MSGRTAALLALLLVAAPALAQSPSDVSVVLASDNGDARLDEALALFDMYEATGDEAPANRARELLRFMHVDASTRDAHALASAIVLARGPDSRMRIGAHAHDWFVDPNSLASVRSLRLLRGVLQRSPAHREAALELATWAIERDHPLVAAEAEIALAALAPDHEVLLARARLNALLGEVRLTADLATAAERAGADRSRSRHVRAYALMQESRSVPAGVEAYFEGAEAMTAAARIEYERAVGPIMTIDQLEAWRVTPDAEAAPFLRRFWERSAAHAGVTLGERMGEHYRRLHHARTEFPADAPMSSEMILARTATGIDSRMFAVSLPGYMLVRHGDPDALTAMSRCFADTFTAPMECTSPEQMREARRIARSESFDPFARRLPFGADVYAFRGDDDAVDLIYAATLPARTANAFVDPSGDMAVLLSAILIPETGDVVRHDTAFHAPLPPRFDPMAGGTDAIALLHATLPVAAVDSTFTWRMTLSDPFRHAGSVAGGSVATPALAGFTISSIAVAPADAGASLRRGERAFAAAPYFLYRSGQTLALYYEVYGLADGAAYRTEIELAPARAGVLGRVRGLLDSPVRLRFDNVAAAPDARFGVQEQRTIAFDEARPGVWRLTVRVTDTATGRTVERVTLVDVAPPAEATSE